MITEVNGDTAPDVYLVQNFFSPQPETGHMDGGLSLLLQGQGDGNFQTVGPADSGLIVPLDAKSLVAADLDEDGYDEWIVGVNNAAPLCFTRQTPPAGHLITVRLSSTLGNADAIGARVTLIATSGSRQTAEVHAGSGYLSQSAPSLVFGAAQLSDVKTLLVRWPDGTSSTASGNGGRSYRIEKTKSDMAEFQRVRSPGATPIATRRERPVPAFD